MNESDGRAAAIEWLENKYDGWTIESAGNPGGGRLGECFKLYGQKGEPRHILGLTRDLFLESDSREELWQHLQTHKVKERLAFAGMHIVWLGTRGYLKD